MKEARFNRRRFLRDAAMATIELVAQLYLFPGC